MPRPLAPRPSPRSLALAASLVAASLGVLAPSRHAAAQFATTWHESAPQTVRFEVERTPAAGRHVYLLGSIVELGSNDPRRAVKLARLPVAAGQPQRWGASVALPRGTAYTYRFIERDIAAGRGGDVTNTFAPSADIAATTPGTPPTRAVRAALTMQDPVLNWRTPGGALQQTVMHPVGPGRTPAERTWAASIAPVPSTSVEFFITDASAPGRSPASGSLFLAAPVVHVQDGAVFGALPPAEAVQPAQRDYDPSDLEVFASPRLQESRPYRVYLPRGYNQQPHRRYPVLYLNDGQNVIEPGAFGAWNAHTTLDLVTRIGACRDTILVAVDHGPDRAGDYLDPSAGGNADDYLHFLTKELMPFINASYRTLPGRENTFLAGSSFGGVVSTYAAVAYATAFGGVGVFSPSFWATQLDEAFASAPAPPVRIYLDSGDAGTSSDGYTDTLQARDDLLARPDRAFVFGDNLYHIVGFGQSHNEAAWAARFDECLRFLLPLAREPVTLPVPCPADLDGDGLSTIFDLFVFLADLEANRRYTDTNQSGTPDAPDILNFLTILAAGCNG